MVLSQVARSTKARKAKQSQKRSKRKGNTGERRTVSIAANQAQPHRGKTGGHRGKHQRGRIKHRHLKSWGNAASFKQTRMEGDRRERKLQCRKLGRKKKWIKEKEIRFVVIIWGPGETPRPIWKIKN